MRKAAEGTGHGERTGVAGRRRERTPVAALRRTPPLAALAGLALVGWGCDPDGGPQQAGVVMRDSAGVHIVENPAERVERALTVSPDPVLSIGVVEGDPDDQLFQVSAAARLSDGSVVVANAGSREARVYGPDGRHRVTVGGAGQGPSEFRYPASIVVEAGDTFVVQDMLDRVRFGPDGAFLGRTTTDRGQLQEAIGPEAMAEGGVWLPDGWLFTPLHRRDEAQILRTPGPPFRPPMTLVRIRPDLSAMDTLGEFGGILQQMVDVGAPGPWPIVPPFFVSTSWAHGAPDGTLLVADSESPEFHLFRGDGTRVLVRWPGTREPVTAAEVEAWKAQQRASSWAQRQLPQLERGWAGMAVPDRKAAYGSLVGMGRDGSVWIPLSADHLADPATFLVFAPDGVLRGRVSVPGPFRVMDGRVMDGGVTDGGPDWLLGVWRDENEVEFLRMYQVTG